MRKRRMMSISLMVGIAVTLSACEVETIFVPNDAFGSGDDVLTSRDAPETELPPDSCGGCGAFEDCIDEQCVPTYCPPNGPFGVMAGDTLTNAVVKDCDGNDVRIHELCGSNAGFFNLLAGW